MKSIDLIDYRYESHPPSSVAWIEYWYGAIRDNPEILPHLHFKYALGSVQGGQRPQLLYGEHEGGQGHTSYKIWLLTIDNICTCWMQSSTRAFRKVDLPSKHHHAALVGLIPCDDLVDMRFQGEGVVTNSIPEEYLDPCAPIRFDLFGIKNCALVRTRSGAFLEATFENGKARVRDEKPFTRRGIYPVVVRGNLSWWGNKEIQFDPNMSIPNYGEILPLGRGCESYTPSDILDDMISKGYTPVEGHLHFI